MTRRIRTETDEYGLIPEPEVVLCEDLIPALRPELDRRTAIYNKHEKTSTHLHGYEHVEPGGTILSPIQLLSIESGISERGVYRILSGETLCVDLDLADRLCLALGMNLSVILPEDAFLGEHAAHSAGHEQARIMRTVARSKGDFVPEPRTPEARTWGGQYRRKLQAEKDAA